MSVLQYQEAINSSDLQIWNNAAFDNGESEDSSTIRSSWCPLKPLIVNPSESIDSVSSKENRSPVLLESLVPVKSPAPVKPLPPNCAIGNSQPKPTKVIPKQILGEKVISKSENEQVVRDEKKIDDEIEEIEKEISRLSSRLEVLRVEKAEHNVKFVERRASGRVVPAKFMESKQVVKNTDTERKMEEASSMSAKSKIQRRGFTMGPSEIMAGVRRGVSLGPSEIAAGVKFRQLGKQELTPVHPPNVRRKSCFWKLQDIDEEMGKKERKKSLSLSPKSRKALCKTQSSRQAATTIGSKKTVKKEDAVLASIQPKKLFKDGEKSVPAKKPLKQLGRVISSRYNQSTVQSASKSAMRNRSSLENDEDGIKMFDKKRASSVGKSRETSRVQGAESRVKKRWQIPSELVVVNEKFEVEESPISITAMADKLPRIRILRCANDTARDSGPAKRVADLVGKKSFFSDDEDEVPFVCQALKFDEEVEQK